MDFAVGSAYLGRDKFCIFAFAVKIEDKFGIAFDACIIENFFADGYDFRPVACIGKIKFFAVEFDEGILGVAGDRRGDNEDFFIVFGIDFFQRVFQNGIFIGRQESF